MGLGWLSYRLLVTHSHGLTSSARLSSQASLTHKPSYLSPSKTQTQVFMGPRLSCCINCGVSCCINCGISTSARRQRALPYTRTQRSTKPPPGRQHRRRTRKLAHDALVRLLLPQSTRHKELTCSTGGPAGTQRRRLSTTRPLTHLRTNTHKVPT